MNRKKFEYLLLVFYAAVIVFAFITGKNRNCLVADRTDYSDALKIQAEYFTEENEYVYRYTLPESNVDGKSIAVNTSHMRSEVFIGEEKVYECIAEETSKSTGYRWNFISLYEKDTGKTVTVRQISPYSIIKPEKLIYYGDTESIYREIVYNDAMRLIVSVIVFLTGFLLFLYSVFVIRLEYDDATPVFFAVLSMVLSLWTVSGSKTAALVFKDSLACTMINQYSLMILPLICLQFMRQIYTCKESKIWDAAYYTGSLIVIIRAVLDVTAAAELRETLIITQAYFILIAAIGLAVGIYEYLKNRTSYLMKMNVVCIIGVLAAALLELIMFRFFGKDRIYGIFCFMIYLFLMTINVIKHSMQMSMRANEAEIYKNLAYTDELTGVYNRTAFRNDLDKQKIKDENSETVKINPMVIFMFDLNDLKKCNDQLGHEKGDEYIISVSGIISDVFGIEGRCYRIGGDEFSVLMPVKSKNEIENKINIIHRRVLAANKRKFVVKMSVSAGYALFDPDEDEDLDATLKRADKMMYENKRKYKEGISV